MSRCYPYPPPGYALTNSRKEALIESIKFQKEHVKAEEPRKKDRKEKNEKRKEKKERKKEKKEKRKDKKYEVRNQDNSGVVHGRMGENFWSDAKVDFLRKGSCSDSEQLERSTLTEEHAKPVSLLLPSTSSDSTENSNKKKRHAPVNISRGHGNIIRIRLTSKKQNQPNASVDEQKHCSTSGRTQFPAEAGNDNRLIQRSEAFRSTPGSTGRERVHIASKQIETAPVFETLHLTPMQKEGLLYQNLMENLTPPGFMDGCVPASDEDWLFGAKNKAERSEKKSVCQNDRPTHCNTASLWPTAQYLPEVDVYALPYTLPF